MPNVSAEKTSICINNCLISCEIVRYQVMSNSDYRYIIQDLPDSNSDSKICKSELLISSTNFHYPIYTEIFVFEFYSFVASLGGILSLWIGIDIIFCIDSVFTVKNWILLAYHYFKLRNKSQNTEGIVEQNSAS